MVRIVKGRIMPFNRYVFEDYYVNYRKQYIIKLSSLHDFKKWAEGVVRPLLGNKYLVEITEDGWIRHMNDSLVYLEGYIDHNYIDIIWLPVDNKVDESATIIEMVDLNKNSREDFIKQISEDLPYLDKDSITFLLKRINYRWDLYSIYRDILIEQKVVDDSDIKEIVKETAIKSANEIFNVVVFRRRFALNNYYKLQNKYSKRWVKDYFGKELDRIIDAKVRLANREITYKKIRENKRLSKHYYIISNAPLAHLQILRFLLEYPMAIEIWVSNTPLQIYEELMKDRGD